MDPFLVVLACIVVALLVPCRWDPAIRLKEWMEGWHDDEEKRK